MRATIRREQILKLLRQPLTRSQITARLGLSRNGVWALMRDLRREGLIVVVETDGAEQIYQRAQKPEASA